MLGSEIDQLYKICCVLGAPEWNIFPEAANISRLVDITYSDVSSCEVCHKNRFFLDFTAAHALTDLMSVLLDPAG